MKNLVLSGILLLSTTYAVDIYGTAADNSSRYRRPQTTYGYASIPADREGYEDAPSPYGYDSRQNGNGNGNGNGHDIMYQREQLKNRTQNYYEQDSLDNGTAGGGGEAGPQAID